MSAPHTIELTNISTQPNANLVPQPRIGSLPFHCALLSSKRNERSVYTFGSLRMIVTPCLEHSIRGRRRVVNRFISWNEAIHEFGKMAV